jgi:hypothetical protein
MSSSPRGALRAARHLGLVPAWHQGRRVNAGPGQDARDAVLAALGDWLRDAGPAAREEMRACLRRVITWLDRPERPSTASRPNKHLTNR